MAYLKRIKAMGVTLPHISDHNKDAWVLDSTDDGRGVIVQLFTGAAMTRKIGYTSLDDAIKELSDAGYDTRAELVDELMIPGTELLTVEEYAALHNTTPDNIRHRIYNGRHDGAVKRGTQWFIPRHSPYEDGRKK